MNVTASLVNGVLMAACIAGCGNTARRACPPTEPSCPPTPADAAPAADATLPRDSATSPPFTPGPPDARDTRLFVPDVPHSYSGALHANPGLELTAFTLTRDADGQLLFMAAIRNVSPSPLCNFAFFRFYFVSAAGETIGTAGSVLYQAAHRRRSGPEGRVICLSPGQTGHLGTTPIGLDDGEPGAIASLVWSVDSELLLDVVPVEALLRVANLRQVPDPAGGSIFAAELVNDTTGTQLNPTIGVFGLNAVGRPIVYSWHYEEIGLSAGGDSLTFTTTPRFEGTVGELVPYVFSIDPRNY